MKPKRVYGVDFSGAVDAGRKTWIAGGVIEGDALHLESCRPAANLPGSSRQRERALEALCVFILDHTPCAVGLDFPFGLPRSLVAENRWDDFVDLFASQYPDADTFKALCWQAAGSKELRRMTDVVAGTPFSAYNLRLYRQTYHGIRYVLAELVRSGKVSVLPMQPAVSGRTWIMEICPASTLKDIGLYQTYKKAKSGAIRDQILSELMQKFDLSVPEHVRVQVRDDDEGDALDSVIAAVATYRGLGGTLTDADPDSLSAIEGSVYV